MTVSVPAEYLSLELLGGVIDGGSALTLTSSGSVWTGGEISSVTISMAGGAFGSGVNQKKISSGAQLNLAGTTNWDGGEIVTAGASTTIKNKGVFTAKTDSTVTDSTAGVDRATFRNEGTFNKSGSAPGVTAFETRFDNIAGASVSVQVGTLKLKGGGTSSGNVSLDDGAALVIGTTNYEFAGGTLNATGANKTGLLTIESATATFNGTSGSANVLVTSGGSADFTGTHSGTGKLILSSGTVTSSTGTGQATFNALEWTGGTVSGKVTVTGAPSVSGGAKTIDASGDLTVSGGTTASSAWTATSLSNQGKLTHASGLTDIQGTFSNTGVLNVKSGKLQLAGGGGNDASASILVEAAGQLEISNDFELHATSELKGAGAVRILTGTFTANGSVAIATVDFNGGTLAGSHTFERTVNWNSAGWSAGSGLWTTTIAPDAVLNIGNGTTHDFNRRSITNNGTINWQAGNLRGGNGSVFTNNLYFNDVNGGTKTLMAPGAFSGTSSFTNNGHYNKTVGGTTTIEVPFINNGALNVSAGSIIFTSTFTNGSNATAQFSTPLTFGPGTELRGTGTINAPTVTASGVFAPGSSPGTMTFIGDFTLENTSRFLVEIGGLTPGTNHDFVSVTGAAVFAGSLSVSLTNGFWPAATNTFTVLTASNGVSGLFTNAANGERIFTGDGAGSFLVNYGAGSPFTGLTNSIVLSNFAPIPEPSTWALLGVGATFVLINLRRKKR